MPRLSSIFADAIKSGVNSDAFKTGYAQQGEDERNKDDNDAALRQLIKGKEMDDAAKNQMLTRQIAEAERLRGMYGPEASVNVEGVSVGARDPLQALLRKRELDTPKLTPGQIEAEKKSAQKVADFEAGGGRSVADQNMRQIEEVQKELAEGKRDYYDRVVGGFTSNFPTVMGIVAPAEKQRRDKIRNTANSLAKQSDPNPTQQQIETLMGQLYDTSSDNAGNVSRLKDFATKQRQSNEQLSQAAENLRSTGYATPGLAGNPVGAPGGAPAPRPRNRQPVKVLQNRTTGQKKIIYDDGSEEIQ